ncbi:hypothetical protein GCM10011419_26830 [Vogesella fluminis]|uniref:ESPR domain-containing protein n=1 Tax=Vogesella fluminis TaxID=1069161 RepID=A0ABQ3HGP7_9NEIS|nr:hypothetical protein GCM10011419_26830 [Vogesella fluminis]
MTENQPYPLLAWCRRWCGIFARQAGVWNTSRAGLAAAWWLAGHGVGPFAAVTAQEAVTRRFVTGKKSFKNNSVTASLPSLRVFGGVGKHAANLAAPGPGGIGCNTCIFLTRV